MEQDVNVSEIAVDLPVSEALVKQKMKSLGEIGLIQPLAVWQPKMLIIDGFHRLEAAKRLGWQTIRCSLLDVTEEQFWASRIDSAKQHHEIERPRLLAWIRQCWQAADHTDDITDVLWSLRKKLGDSWSFQRKHLHLTQGEADTLQWFDDHAARWNMTSWDVFDAVLSDIIPNIGMTRAQDRFQLVEIAVANDLSKTALTQTAKELGMGAIGEGKRDIPVPAVQKFIEAGMPEGKLRTFATEVKQQQEERENAIRAELWQKRQDEQAKHAAQLASAKYLVDSAAHDLAYKVDTLTAFCQSKAKYLAAHQESRQDVLDCITKLTEFAAATWPTPESAAQAWQALLDEERKRSEVNAALSRVAVVSSTEIR